MENNEQITENKVREDREDGWLNALAFIIPLFGIIYFFMKKDEEPKMAKGVLKWGVIGIIVHIVLVVLFALLLCTFVHSLFVDIFGMIAKGGVA